jgi:hypothetical protein
MTQLTNEQQKYLRTRVQEAYQYKMTELKSIIRAPSTKITLHDRVALINDILQKAGATAKLTLDHYGAVSIMLDGDVDPNEYVKKETERRDKLRKELTEIKNEIIDNIVLGGELGELQSVLARITSFDTGVV